MYIVEKEDEKTLKIYTKSPRVERKNTVPKGEGKRAREAWKSGIVKIVKSQAKLQRTQYKNVLYKVWNI